MRRTKFSDTEIKQSYDVMNLLKDCLFLHSYSYPDPNDVGSRKSVTTLNFRTKDGKVHQITSTETSQEKKVPALLRKG